MDKARFAGVTALQYFGLVPKEVSFEEAAKQLVQELTEEGSTYGGNSSAVDAGASAPASNAAKAALQIMYGQAAGNDHGRQCMAGKIDAARKKFLKGVGEGNKEKFAADFDEKVKEGLGNKLSDRARFLYGEQKQKMKDAFANGLMTKSQCDQSMVEFLHEVERPCPLKIEVENALRFIGSDETRVARGLFYLFGGDLDEEQNKEFQLFDQIREEALGLTCTGERNNKESKAIFRREFIVEARQQLASRLPERSRSKYFSVEKEMQKKMKNGNITYDNYRNSMTNWVNNRGLSDAVARALEPVKTGEDVCKLLAYLMKAGWYNHRMASLYQRHDPELEEDVLYNSFAHVAYQYACSDTVLSLSEERKYNQLVQGVKKRLLASLPEKIKQALKEHENVTGKLRNDGLITAEGYQESRNRYLLNMVSPEQGKRVPDSPSKSMHLDKSNPEGQALQQLVDNALAECITTEAASADVLEALIMCWGGHVANHRQGFSLRPLCEAKDDFWRSQDSEYTGRPLTTFFLNDPFSIEARDQLCAKLPVDLREKYLAREALLRQHLEKGTITPEAYRTGMLMFLVS